jgi:putative hydrolase of the HAD superfamily
MPKQNILQKGAVQVLKYLKQKGYQLFIITNGFREVQYKKLENSELLNFFNNVFISEVIKVPKPGKEIFEYSIKSANAKKTKSLMIGDDWEGDVLGAVAFGIDAVFYDPDHKITEKQSARLKELNRVSTIHELKDLLEFL